MIDFRYHIVSLIAVFLALAVGIVLGAGPLREYIADQLTGQVEQLRAEKEELRIELEAADANEQRRTDFITASAPTLLDSALEGRSVVLVELPGASGDVTTALEGTLGQAGAEVVGRIGITETWVDPDQRAFRSGIAQNLVAYLDPQPAADASTEAILAAALGQALTQRDPADTSAPSADASTMYQLLVSSELVAEVAAPSGPAYATVVVAPAAPPVDSSDEELEAVADRNAQYGQLAAGLASAGEGSVLAGTDGNPGDLLTAVRADEGSAERVTTVDSAVAVTGQVTVPLALNAAIAGTGGHYGFGAGVDAVLPEPVTLEQPDPQQFAPTPPEAPDGGDQGTTDEPSDAETTAGAGG